MRIIPKKIKVKNTVFTAYGKIRTGYRRHYQDELQRKNLYRLGRQRNEKRVFGALRKQENQAVFGQYQCGKPRKQ